MGFTERGAALVQAIDARLLDRRSKSHNCRESDGEKRVRDKDGSVIQLGKRCAGAKPL